MNNIIETKKLSKNYFLNKKLNVLNNINIKIKKGELVALLGPSGSGKSTLLMLIGGLVEATKGKIYLDKFMLSNVNLNHYRSHLGLALSEETTFEATIKENITFGNPDVSDEQLMWAIEKVGLYQFIKESPKGVNTILHPAGNQIPFTITRKIVLARAIVNKPKILIQVKKKYFINANVYIKHNPLSRFYLINRLAIIIVKNLVTLIICKKQHSQALATDMC